jgi:hypothetical protein
MILFLCPKCNTLSTIGYCKKCRQNGSEVKEIKRNGDDFEILTYNPGDKTRREQDDM